MSPIKTTSLFVKFSRVTALIVVVTVALVTIVGSGSGGGGSQGAQGAQGIWIDQSILGGQFLAQAQGIGQEPENPPITLLVIASNGDAAGLAPDFCEGLCGLGQMHGDISAGSFGDEVDLCNGAPNGMNGTANTIVSPSCIFREAELSGTARWYDPDGFLSNDEADYAVEGTVTEWLIPDGEGEDGEDAFLVIAKTMDLVIFDDSEDSEECLEPMIEETIGAQAFDDCDPVISVAYLEYVPPFYETPSSNELTQGLWALRFVYPEGEFFPVLGIIAIGADGNIGSIDLEGCTDSLEIQPYNPQFNVYHVSGGVTCPVGDEQDQLEISFSTDGLAILAPCNLVEDVCVPLQNGVVAALEEDVDWLFMAFEAHVDHLAVGEVVGEDDVALTFVFERTVID